MGVAGLSVETVATWDAGAAAYRVRAFHYHDGTEALVIEVFGPGHAQRSAVIRGDVGSLAPLGGWRWSSDAQRTTVVEALFDPGRWG